MPAHSRGNREVMDVEERVDALFRSRPPTFTAARDALVKELKAGGGPDAAAAQEELDRRREDLEHAEQELGDAP